MGQSDADFYRQRNLTASAVALHLAGLADQLDELGRKLDAAERSMVNLREDDTLAFAKVFIGTQGSMDLRKQVALRDTSAHRVAAELAEVTVKGLRRQIRTLELRIDIGRSMGAAVRAEVSLGHSSYST